MGSELSCTPGKQAGGGRKGGESSLPLSPSSLPSFFFSSWIFLPLYNLNAWNRLTLLWTLYLDPLFCVKGALQLITWVLTHGRAARGNPTTAYINTLLRDTMLEILILFLKVVWETKDRPSWSQLDCLQSAFSFKIHLLLMQSARLQTTTWSQFSSRRLLGVDQK